MDEEAFFWRFQRGELPTPKAGETLGIVIGRVSPEEGLLTALALREGLVTGPSLGAALLVAAAFHTLEVAHNVFKRW